MRGVEQMIKSMKELVEEKRKQLDEIRRKNENDK